jgi:D-alanyl-D-alanine carboxypeptidase
MKSNFIVKLAMTTAFVAVPSIGCTSLGISSTKTATSAEAMAKKAHHWARKGEKAIAKGNLDKALMYAELAVEADMHNVDYRAQLARIYMAQGRFQSAERTLMDVMELGQADPRTVISLALTRIAQSRVDSAISLVEANRAIVPASDYGLLLALAGQQGKAIEVLTDAIRADNATARTRQNLALAYAMDNRWREARIMAVQDMAQERVNDRIVEWAQYARPGAYEQRVAGLLKVTPQADNGQPVRLALATIPVGMAQAEVAVPVSSPVSLLPAAPQELAAVGPAPVSQSAGFSVPEVDVRVAAAPVAPVPMPVFEAPLIKAQSGPSKSVLATPAVKPLAKPVKLALATVEPKVSSQRSVAGSHVVQLGAFSSAEGAKVAWDKLSGRYNILHGFYSASSSVKVNGKTFIRLAATGFGNFAAADAVCKSIKSKGGDCIVRSVTGEQPVRLAAAAKRKNVAHPTRRLASR